MIGGASRTRLGVSASITSSVLFGAVFVIAGFIDLSANTIFGWRSVTMVAALVALLTAARRWGGMRVLARRIRERPLLGVALLFTGGMLGLQQWLFSWAPGAGRGLPVSLGYFIMPIVLALVGRMVFRERLGPWRIAAVAMASVAVAYQTALVGGLSWETLVVALGYPCYFAVRRLAGITGIAGLAAESMVVLPVSVVFLASDQELPAALADPASLIVLIVFAVLAAAALMLYIAASSWLPLTIFGLLSYLEPLLLALGAAVVLGEPLRREELPTFIAIAIALALLALESVARRRPPRNEPIIS